MRGNVGHVRTANCRFALAHSTRPRTPRHRDRTCAEVGAGEHALDLEAASGVRSIEAFDDDRLSAGGGSGGGFTESRPDDHRSTATGGLHRDVDLALQISLRGRCSLPQLRQQTTSFVTTDFAQRAREVNQIVLFEAIALHQLT